MEKGIFIAIYGINNIGKTTHSKLLVEKLNASGKKTKYVKFPIYDLEPTGPFLDKTLRSADGQKISEDELQMWFVLNRYQFEPQLKKWLEEGYIVVAEDYVGTGMAWGMAKGLDEEWMESINEKLLKEDFSVLMEGNRAMDARENVHLHEQNDELVKKCAKTHSALGDKHEWSRVQVQPKIDDTATLIWDLVDDFL